MTRLIPYCLILSDGTIETGFADFAALRRNEVRS